MRLRGMFALLWALGAFGVLGCSGDDSGDGGSGGSVATSSTGSSGAGGSTAGNTTSTGGATSAGGGSGGITGAPDIDLSTPTDDLTEDEKAALCDWTQDQRGGYGVTVDCGHQQMASTFDDQAECVALGFLHGGCDPTAAMWVACQIALVPDDGCITPPECLAISEC